MRIKLCFTFFVFGLVFSVCAFAQTKVCSYCKGKGVVECYRCDGYGYLEPGYGPRGNGQSGGGNTTCPECKGAKNIECPLKKEYPQLHPGTQQSTTNQQKKSYRQHFSDGSYADVTENSDGTTTHVMHRKCYSCKGTGRCSVCNGVGSKIVGVYTKQWLGCTFCGGSGKCKYCNGTGETIMVNTYDPRTNSTVGQDLYTGKTYRSTYGERHSENESSSHSTTTSSSSCSICNGTGIDSFPWEDPTSTVGQRMAWGYTNQAGNKCPYCSKYTWHKHAYCPKCKADKYH